ncbi:hypothetical protein DSL36_06950 [Mycobacterium tuberculosis]|nr:hypothetical protein DSK07_18865 [Mycobacterium tuberculosis]REZ10526.1 hypothetical protein DSL36_06950 [Mycobacterium tuberculosis]
MMIASAAKPGAVPRKREVPPGHHHRTSDDRKRGEAGRSPPQAGGAPRSSPSIQLGGGFARHGVVEHFQGFPSGRRGFLLGFFFGPAHS